MRKRTLRKLGDAVFYVIVGILAGIIISALIMGDGDKGLFSLL